MPFIVVDDRFGTPIHVFLEADPRADAKYPGLPVTPITLERRTVPARESGYGVPPGAAIGADSADPTAYREFGSEAAAAAARFAVVEPRYVGPDWSDYVKTFCPGGRSTARPGKSKLSGTVRNRGGRRVGGPGRADG